jgi:hypothetical protein
VLRDIRVDVMWVGSVMPFESMSLSEIRSPNVKEESTNSILALRGIIMSFVDRPAVLLMYGELDGDEREAAALLLFTEVLEMKRVEFVVLICARLGVEALCNELLLIDCGAKFLNPLAAPPFIPAWNCCCCCCCCEMLFPLRVDGLYRM